MNKNIFRITCHFCGIDTWSTDYVQFMSDHDRPDGRVCQKAKKEIALCRSLVEVMRSDKKNV